MKLDKKALIIGFGSAGQKHAKSLEKIIGKRNIFIFSKNNLHSFIKIKRLNTELNNYIDYVIISTETSRHYFFLKLVDKIFKKKKILIEKPLGLSAIKNNYKNNEYLIGYNLRYHPLLLKLKNMVSNEKIYNINISCFSYLPNWRTNKNSYSLYKNQGGGVEFDLSHEIDYLLWIFGKIKTKSVTKKKLSKLTYDSNDFLNINGVMLNGSNFQIILSYFSKINQRKVIVDCENISVSLDFLKSKLISIKSNKKKIYLSKNFKLIDTFYLMHKDILSNENSNKLPNIKFNNQLHSIINSK